MLYNISVTIKAGRTVILDPISQKLARALFQKKVCEKFEVLIERRRKSSFQVYCIKTR